MVLLGHVFELLEERKNVLVEGKKEVIVKIHYIITAQLSDVPLGQRLSRGCGTLVHMFLIGPSCLGQHDS